MDNLIYFPSDKIHSPYSEIKRFIDFVKQLSELNENIRFDENYWKGEVNFVKTGISSKDRSPENLLHHSILEFAKAYVKYQRITLYTTNFTEPLSYQDSAFLKLPKFP